jgi:hypothetical protein
MNTNPGVHTVSVRAGNISVFSDHRSINVEVKRNAADTGLKVGCSTWHDLDDDGAWADNLDNSVDLTESGTVTVDSGFAVFDGNDNNFLFDNGSRKNQFYNIFSSGFSASCIVNITSGTNQRYYGIIGTSIFTANSAGWHIYFYKTAVVDEFRFGFRLTDGRPDTFIDNFIGGVGNEISPGVDYHLVLTVNPNGSAQLYKDGVAFGNSKSLSGLKPNIFRYASSLHVGAKLSNRPNCKIRNMPIWKRELSAAEVLGLWNGGSPKGFSDVFP